MAGTHVETCSARFRTDSLGRPLSFGSAKRRTQTRETGERDLRIVGPLGMQSVRRDTLTDAPSGRQDTSRRPRAEQWFWPGERYSSGPGYLRPRALRRLPRSVSTGAAPPGACAPAGGCLEPRRSPRPCAAPWPSWSASGWSRSPSGTRSRRRSTRPGASCSSPHGPATLVAGSSPRRADPMWCGGEGRVLVRRRATPPRRARCSPRWSSPRASRVRPCDGACRISPAPARS